MKLWQFSFIFVVSVILLQKLDSYFDICDISYYNRIGYRLYSTNLVYAIEREHCMDQFSLWLELLCGAKRNEIIYMYILIKYE